jgi:hypothetical protein
MKLRASKRGRNVFRSIDYDILDIQRVQFLSLTFNGDVFFELPPLGNLALKADFQASFWP